MKLALCPKKRFLTGGCPLMNSVPTPKRPGVYAIRNKNTGHLYVGSTTESVFRRWQKHSTKLNRGKHENRLLQASWKFHGPDSFSFSTIANCDEKWTAALESIFIKKFDCTNEDTGFNLSRNPKPFRKNRPRRPPVIRTPRRKPMNFPPVEGDSVGDWVFRNGWWRENPKPHEC